MDVNLVLVICVVALSVVLIWWIVTESLLQGVTDSLAEDRELLKKIFERVNVTVTLKDNDTDKLNESGAISGIGKAEIIQ